MPKPVGSDPIEINGVVMRKSHEIPRGLQALYDRDGNLMRIQQIGMPGPVDARPAASITLNPVDYEIVLASRDRAKKRPTMRH